MIRLTINPKTTPEIHLFNKPTVIIGSEKSPEADIALSGMDLRSTHLKIIEQNHLFILINVVNDPFITINGHPFGKKLLNDGDVISIHHHECVFENLDNLTANQSSLSPKKKKSSERSKNLAEKKLVSGNQQDSTPSLLNLSLPFEKEVDSFQEGEWHLSDANHYLKEEIVEQKTKEAQPVSLPPSLPSNEKKETGSLKDDYLRDLDDDNHAVSIGLQPTEQNHLYHAWKWIIFFIFSVLTIAGIIGTVVYLTVSDNTEAQEVKVAQGMSDIAMALTHAQLHHLKPNNQNWSDIDFIKANLQAILSQTHSYASEIDLQGQFTCCPYSLRIYTSSDLSHFLLIAQPAPSFLHWLIPKSVILVDSMDMELRSIKDLRSLNRLLANPDPLDGSNGKEIQGLVKQGYLIRLSSLAYNEREADFAPPKPLTWAKPGAENFIYNAPRYYRLGQAFIQKATALSTSKGSSQEVAELRSEMDYFSHLNHLIFYAEQGKKSALLAKQAIMTFCPSDKVLFGYLSFNNQGKIYQAHLLKDEDEINDTSLVAIANIKKEEEVFGISPIPQNTKEQLEKDQALLEEANKVDINHPIYIQLNALAHARETDLRPTVQALTTLLNQETQFPTLLFEENFQELSQQYLSLDAKHKEKIKEVLSNLYYQYEDMSIADFLTFAKQAKFDQLIQRDTSSLVLADNNDEQNLDSLLNRIEKAKTLLELDNLMHMTCAWLNFDHVKNSEELISYHNLLRNEILSKLERFLLSYQEHLPVDQLNSEDKEALKHVLNHERMIHSDEREFFLEEIDHLMNELNQPALG